MESKETQDEDNPAPAAIQSPEETPKKPSLPVATIAKTDEDYTVPTILLAFMEDKCKLEAAFLDNVYPYFKNQLERIWNKPKPFTAVKLWFQNHTECTCTIRNWGELVKLICITALNFPEWTPEPFCGLHIPQLINQMHSQFN